MSLDESSERASELIANATEQAMRLIQVGARPDRLEAALPYPTRTMWTSPGPWTPVTIVYSMSAVRLGPVIRFM